MTLPDLTGGLEMLEIVSGIVFGKIDEGPEPPRGRFTPQQALESAIIPHLRASPCGVAFSGGRDSAAVLAAATTAARRIGADDPIPVTMRFPHHATTEETDFQESVVRYLGLSEWIVVEPEEPLDVLNATATDLTLRHGLLYPANIHFLIPVLDAIRGGSLLTGVGGDEVLDGHENYAMAAALTGKQFPSKGVLRRLAKRYLMPARVTGQLRTDISRNLPWLFPDVRTQVADRIIEYQDGAPLFADRYLVSLVHRIRYLTRATTDMGTVGQDFGVVVANPLLNPAVIGAVADGIGRTGFRTRTEAMHRFFGDALPDEILERTSKATFDNVLWTPRTSEVASTLSIDLVAEYVDSERLRQLWASDALKGNTALLAKFLAAHSAYSAANESTA